MRTLNKTLSLVLALVLCLGLVGTAFAANYDKYTDADKVGAAYAEAVDVMMGTGIIKGMSDTEIGATGTLTREQAAKIVTYMVLGEKLANALKADKAPFTDVAADRWSAGYIAYCVKAGILAGYGDGKFGPTDELTGFQFAKMLLVALGFKGEYTGDGWAIAVAQDAFKADLFKGDETAAANTAMQRQQAMLVAFNGLNYSATAATSVYEVKDGATVIYKGSDALTALVMQQAKATNTLSLVESKTGSLGAVNYGLTKTTKTDDFGRDSVAYTNGKTAKAEVIYSKTAPVAVKTYTTATTYGKIVADLGYTKVADKVNFNICTNGNDTTKTDVTKTDATAVGGNGVLVEVYKTATANTYDVVIVNTYFKKLVAADITAAVKATATTDAKAAYITLDGLTFETDAFKANDVVLYTKTDSKIVSVVKAEYVSGKVTATAAGYFKVDGEKMQLANGNAAVIGTTAGYAVNATTSYTYYKDAYGYVVLAEEGVTAPVAKNYVYVVKTAAKAAGAAGTGETLFDTTAGAAAKAQAQIYDIASNSLKVVDLAVVKGTGAAAAKYFFANAQGKATANEVGVAAVLGTGATAAAPYAGMKIYEYVTLEDGSYVLTALAETEAVTLEKGKATGVTGKTMTSATVVTLVEYTVDAKTGALSADVTTMNGIANFPATAKGYDTAIVTADAKTGAVTSIVIVAQKAAAVASTKYAIYNGPGETDATGTKYGFYVDGELVEFYLKAGTTFTANKGDVVSYTLENGKVNSVAKKTALATDVTVGVVDETFFTAGGNTYYFAKTGFTAFDKTTKAAATLTAGAKVTVYGAGENSVEYIVVG